MTIDLIIKKIKSLNFSLVKLHPHNKMEKKGPKKTKIKTWFKNNNSKNGIKQHKIYIFKLFLHLLFYNFFKRISNLTIT